MLYNDDALEDSPELLLQLDGANDSDVERPGKVEVVTGRALEEEEKDGGGWVVVETQRKTRKEPTREVENRTGRLKRMYPILSQYYSEDSLVRREEVKGTKHLLEVEEKMKTTRKIARSARG